MHHDSQKNISYHNEFELNGLATIAIEKIKILRAVLELPAKLHCQFGPFSW
jgi:hypothetical protein